MAIISSYFAIRLLLNVEHSKRGKPTASASNRWQFGGKCANHFAMCLQPISSLCLMVNKNKFFDNYLEVLCDELLQQCGRLKCNLIQRAHIVWVLRFNFNLKISPNINTQLKQDCYVLVHQRHR